MTPLMELELARISPNRGTTRELEKIWVAFVKLQRLRHEVMSDFESVDEADESTDLNLVESVFTPISIELRELAHRAAKIEAQCREDIEYKAVVLSEFLAAGDCSIHTTLAESLVKDIKKIGQEAAS